jgi:4-amino-4-deoxy-L-arabinose transferase-like glycosyltransferase
MTSADRPRHGYTMTDDVLPGTPLAATGSARSGSETTWLRRSALLVIAALAGLSYAWQLNQDPLEPYYAAAVRSMAGSWHDFIFGAFDPAGTITLDKLPGAFWVQALSVRAFGYSTWAMVLPQVVEGVITVLVLYRAVERLAGPAAGLIAALVLAASPAVVALNRGNISDSLMILLLVLAADAVSGAIARDGVKAEADGRLRRIWQRVSGNQGRLILAAFWVGLAFQAKMIEAWMVLPALGLAYLIAGPGTTGRRVRELVIVGVVAGVVSLLWMTAVSLVPAASRPYVDGSHNDSVYTQVFVYNGFGRFGEQTPLQLITGEIHGNTNTSLLSLPISAPSAGRLLDNDLGRDAGWLLPAAAVIAIWGIASLRRRPRRDPLRACLILWGGWLLTLWVTFSATTTINTYYTAALAPAVGAILGAGVAVAWAADRTAVGRRIGLAVIVAGTSGYAAWLVPSTGNNVPGWLVPAVIAVGVVAAVTALASLAVRRDAVFAAAVGAGIIAGSLAPAVASAGMVAHHESAGARGQGRRLAVVDPDAGEPGSAAAGGHTERGARPDGGADLRACLRVLLHRRGGAPDRRVHRHDPVADPEPDRGRRPHREVPPRGGLFRHHRPAHRVDRRPLPGPHQARGRRPALLLLPAPADTDAGDWTLGGSVVSVRCRATIGAVHGPWPARQPSPDHRGKPGHRLRGGRSAHRRGSGRRARRP